MTTSRPESNRDLAQIGFALEVWEGLRNVGTSHVIHLLGKRATNPADNLTHITQERIKGLQGLDWARKLEQSNWGTPYAVIRLGKAGLIACMRGLMDAPGQVRHRLVRLEFHNGAIRLRPVEDIFRAPAQPDQRPVGSIQLQGESPYRYADVLRHQVLLTDTARGLRIEELGSEDGTQIAVAMTDESLGGGEVDRLIRQIIDPTSAPTF